MITRVDLQLKYLRENGKYPSDDTEYAEWLEWEILDLYNWLADTVIKKHDLTIRKPNRKNHERKRQKEKNSQS